ncbi:gastrula zinc finger protein XlCGF26.1 [Manduca sexta]|uniref:Uncharacterized protein n=1 Tax=Manduca sexta TaxID=7130 RepID=A0A922CTS2_MANSE|nr:gastrula zinc finger protein XlCGF26.1 [Manduca sexta]KAG6459155.1 hypothetical protein O3G_MSEX011239 [Manduca sexta]
MENKKGKASYGKCRCCLAMGHHKDLMKEYYNNGIREVYFDTFMECFNLFLSTSEQLSTLICTSCVSRLRDAISFKMMVVSTERQLLDALIHHDDKHTVFVSVPVEENKLEDVDIKPEGTTEVKQEPPEVQHYDMSYESDFLDNDDCEIEAKDIVDDSVVSGENELLARFGKDTLKPLPSRHTLRTVCPNYVKHLELLKGIEIMPKMIKKLLQENTYRRLSNSRNIYVTEKIAHIVNASTLLEFSNMTPFRSRARNGFPCFYCRNIFENLEKLREHTSGHKKSDINRVLKTYGPESFVVNADITDLTCNICSQSLVNINELKTHLTNIHKKKMHLEFTDRVIPFKLSQTNVFECQICGCNYETFGAIERHMNVHFRNYVCKECGTGFVTKYRLKVHAKGHMGGTFPCEICGKIFASQQKHKNHVDTVHKLVKRFKCTKCPDRFTEYFRRQKHMVEVHGVAPLQYKCNVCERTFERRYTLSRHMKRDHLEERDFQCELCSYKCFTKNELRVHMVKHNGERIFECSVCKKSYARKKTLKEHMRIHNNDRRFACAVCGQAFVQKCSLKGHLKTHHLEFSLP